MTLRTIITAIFATMISILLAAHLVGCSEGNNSVPDAGPETNSEQIAPDELPEQQFFDYRLVETNAGVRQWILDSDLMNKYSGQRDVELITVHIDFYKNGQHFSTLTADSGTANLNTNDIFTWGNVVVVTEDGRRLETEELYFNNTDQLIHNDVFDRFTREGDVIEGIGLEATPDLEYIEIKQQVESDVLDDEQPRR